MSLISSNTPGLGWKTARQTLNQTLTALDIAQNCRAITIKNPVGSGQVVELSESASNANTYELQPGDTFDITLKEPAKIFAKATAGTPEIQVAVLI